jgi:hypothetical protein
MAGVDDRLQQMLNVQREVERLERSVRDTLKTGGGSGTSGGMDSATVDAKIAASEARTDTKFAKLESKIDQLLDKSTDARSEARATRRTVIGTGVSLGALMIAVLGLYTNSFNVGSRVSEIARGEAELTYNRIESRREANPQPVPVPRQGSAEPPAK